MLCLGDASPPLARLLSHPRLGKAEWSPHVGLHRKGGMGLLDGKSLLVLNRDLD